MSNAFSWLSDLMQFLGSLLPKLTIIKYTYAGVKFVRGSNPKYLPPGLHIYWPIVTQVESYPVVRQTIEFPSQVLSTKDEYTLSVGIVIVYTVDDAFTLLTTAYMPEEVLSDVAKGSVAEVVIAHTYKDLLTIDLNNEIAKRCRVLLKKYGVGVERVLVINFAKVRPLHITGITVGGVD